MSRRPLLLLAAIALALAAVGVALALANEGRFRVEGNRIVGPDGEPFVVKGVVAPYGTFAGGDAEGLGRVNERAAAEDFARIADLGANTVKVYVTPHMVADEAGRARLDAVVQAARDAGLVVVLTGFYAEFEEALPFVRRAAATYADDPYVWILPMNEPSCTVPSPGAGCTDYAAWLREHRRYVRAIRAAGMESPIIVNGPGYSWDLSRVRPSALGDPDIVLGAHRYANEATWLDPNTRGEIESGWARFARHRAVVLDEVGNYNPGYGSSIEWARQMIAFAREWVEGEEGSGAVAFNWRWSDPNTLVDPESGVLTEWGRIFAEGFLGGVDG
jgi:hypothetical protein